MRAALFVAFALLVLGSSGCAAYIADSGHHLHRFKTIEEVQTTFGNPKYIEDTEEGQKAYFVTRKKIAEEFEEVYGYQLAAAFSLGLLDPLGVFELSTRYTTDLVEGKVITFTFNNKGEVVAYTPNPSASRQEASEKWYEDYKAEQEALKLNEEKAP